MSAAPPWWAAELLPRWPDLPTIPRTDPPPEPITVAEFQLMALIHLVDQHMTAEAQAMSERPPRHRWPPDPSDPPTDPGDPPQGAPQLGGAKHDTQ